MTGVGPIRLGPTLPSSQRSGLRRLGDVRDGPGSDQLFDDIAPAGAALQGEGHLSSTPEPLQPQSELSPVRWNDPAGADLAGAKVHIVVGELSSMNVEAAKDGHGNLQARTPKRQSTVRPHMPSW
ncbi:MAG: hypothetical protein ACRDHD_09175 [Candidatus Limnocylindria bacterium]